MECLILSINKFLGSLVLGGALFAGFAGDVLGVDDPNNQLIVQAFVPQDIVIYFRNMLVELVNAEGTGFDDPAANFVMCRPHATLVQPLNVTVVSKNGFTLQDQNNTVTAMTYTVHVGRDEASANAAAAYHGEAVRLDRVAGKTGTIAIQIRPGNDARFENLERGVQYFDVLTINAQPAD